MLIQYNKATSGGFKSGQAFAPKSKTYLTNPDFNQGLKGWVIASGGASVTDGVLRVWATGGDGNVGQKLKLAPGMIYEITVNQIGGVGNGQWHLESAPGAGDIFNSSGIDGISSTIEPHYNGDIFIRLTSIWTSGTEYCDFGYVDIKAVEPV